MTHLRGPGVLAAAGAYLIWGLFPLYWSQLGDVPVVQVLAHRVLWCAVCVWLLLAVQGRGRWWQGMAPRVLLALVGSSLLISINWGTYIYGVTSGHVLDTSLGYFITPLVNVLLGVLLLRERLHPLQWAAVALAAIGVGYVVLALGSPPWIALVLAATFGCYGLIRKLVAIDAMRGLAVESCLMLPVAVGYLAWCETQGSGALFHGPLLRDLLLIAGGAVTAVPLVLFAFAARRVPLSTLGFLQYIGPTVQLLLGVFVFHEQFGPTQAVAFGCIWAALALVMLDGFGRWMGRTASRTGD